MIVPKSVILKEKTMKHILMATDFSDFSTDALEHAVYLAKEPNRVKFDALMAFIKTNYVVREETPKSYIMELQKSDRHQL